MQQDQILINFKSDRSLIHSLCKNSAVNSPVDLLVARRCSLLLHMETIKRAPSPKLHTSGNTSEADYFLLCEK